MKGALYLLCGLVGGVAGALLVHYGLDREAPPPRAAPEPRRVVADDSVREAIDELRREVRQLRDRQGPGATPSAPPDAPRGPGTRPAPPPSGPATPEEPEAAPRSVREVVVGLRGRKFGPNESNQLFGWLSVNKEKIPAFIQELEREIKADPNDAELHVALATAWVAQLWNNTPQGMQQGFVWARAEQAYDAAIKLDPAHWQARFGKAFGTSMAPEFLGQRPQAIRQFEELKTIQERGAPEPHHAQTYFRLGTLYKDAGNPEKAREIWAEGLKLFPENAQLKGTLEASTKK
ncbi:MAG: tetratricopeptide repeat protein [Planctomycetota bacterium]|jgi:hypothetical protein